MFLIHDPLYFLAGFLECCELDRLIQSSSLTKVLRDASNMILTNVDLPQPGTFSVRHHPVDPSELLFSQTGSGSGQR